jgi:hypothetical protein
MSWISVRTISLAPRGDGAVALDTGGLVFVDSDQLAAD